MHETTKEYPKTIPELQAELLEHAKDGRSDALFRHAIAIDQIGSLVRHLTHDQELNPESRPHGSKNAEISDAGHAMVQLMTYCALRGINLQEAINTALVNLREKDFIKREATHRSDDLIIGMTGMTGIVRGPALVDPSMSGPDTILRLQGNVENIIREQIIVTSHPFSDFRLKRFAGIVTDHGGSNCHAAIIARESGIPCVVGTGDATKRIKTGDIIEINATVNQGQVKII